jgi:small-conductance mechanosensitive channel
MNNLFAQYYDYSYQSTDAASNVDGAAMAAVFGGLFLFTIFIAVLSYVIFAFLLGRIFKKAGVEAWKAWVPIYNNWVMLELGGQQGLWAVLVFVPLLNIVAAVFMFIAMYHIGLKLGKSGAFVLFAIFLPIVWLVWLAVDDSKWAGKKTEAKATTKNTEEAA